MTQKVAKDSVDTDQQAKSCDKDGSKQETKARWSKGKSQLMERDIKTSGS